MNSRWLGAMPVKDFLDKYVPATEEPLPDLVEDPFRNVPLDEVDGSRHDSFIAVIKDWMPHLIAVNTSNTRGRVKGGDPKTNISIYNRVECVAPPDGTDFSRMELWIDFKSDNDGAPFQDPHIETVEGRRAAIKTGSFVPDTDEGNKARDQLARNAGTLHSVQLRHFSFSVVVQGDRARFLRWDPSGTVVTAAFNYRENSSLMAEFLWRFDHLPPKHRGHDVSVQPANLAPEVDVRVRKQLGIQDTDISLYRYEVPGLLNGKGYAYGPKPPTQNRSFVSRCTRSLPVVWIPSNDLGNDTLACDAPDLRTEGDKAQLIDESTQKLRPWHEERLVYMKDTWRYLDVDILPEHEVYDILYAHRTPNIPQGITGGDVENGKTQTQDLMDGVHEWLCVEPRVSQYQHYRLVNPIVGRPLSKFECTKQLVTAVCDALKAHSHAFNSAKFLHRDISSGNIILTDDGKGLLIDWEMAKSMVPQGNNRPGRAGTWQFMSANLLQNPGRVHTLTDDLESFLHVLGWMLLRYVPSSDAYKPRNRGRDIAKFNEQSVEENCFSTGGFQKGDALGSGSYPSLLFESRCKTPLCKLLKKLRMPFQSLYGQPPADEDRKRTRVEPDSSDEETDRLRFTIKQYDEDIGLLRSSTWFINEVEKVLDEEVWPTDDAADMNLTIAYDCETQYELQVRTSQFQTAHSTPETSDVSSKGPETYNQSDIASWHVALPRCPCCS